jgi:mono/diheme cytochrome c family protein
MKRRVVIHNYLPSRDAIKSGAFYENNRHPMDVGREEEERHRDAAYARTGITRVGRDEGEKKCSRCHGSGSIMMKGMSRPEQCPSCKGTGKTAAKDAFPEAKGWGHLPPATQRQLEDIQRKINALEAKPWSEKLDKEHAALMKKRHELGWENPWIKGIVGGIMGKRR